MRGPELESNDFPPAITDEDTAVIDHVIAQMAFMHEVQTSKDPKTLVLRQRRIITTKVALSGARKAMVIESLDS